MTTSIIFSLGSNIFVFVVYVLASLWLYSHVCRGQRKAEWPALSLSIPVGWCLSLDLELGLYPVSPATLLSLSSTALG